MYERENLNADALRATDIAAGECGCASGVNSLIFSRSSLMQTTYCQNLMQL